VKCPQCGHVQKHHEGMTCRSCQRRYILDPKQGARIGDGRMAAYIRKASENGTRYFTENLIFRLHNDRVNKGASCVTIGFGLVSIGCLIAAVAGAPGFFYVLAAICALLTIGALIAMHKSADFSELSTALDTWQAKDPTPFLIRKPSLEKEPDPPPADDVYDYGVEAVLIAEDRLTVDLLVKNGWHMENKALVISEDGYPKYLRERVFDILERQPELKVYLLHSSGARGMDMENRIRRVGRFSLEGHPVIDLGLHEKDVRKMKRLRRIGRKTSYEIPIDMIGYSTLAIGLGAAVTSGLAFADLLDPRRARDFEGHFSGGWG